MNFSLKKWLFCIFFISFHLIPGYGDEKEKIFQVENNFTSKKISPFLSYYIDEQNSHTIDSIQGLQAGDWKPLQLTPFALPTRDIWFTFAIQDHSHERLFFVISTIKIGIIDFYYQNSAGEWQVIKTGTERPFTSRSNLSPFFTFPMEKTGKIRRYYFHIKSDYRLTLLTRIFTTIEFQQYNQVNLYVHFLFFGIFLFAILYNLFLFVTTKESPFITLVLYVSGWLGLHLHLSGYGLVFFWSSSLWFEKYGLYLFTSIVGGGSVLFLRTYLALDKNHPLLDKILCYTFFSFIGINMVSLSLFPVSITHALESLRGGIQTLFTLFIAIYAVVKKNKNGIFFLLAFFIIPFFNIILILTSIGAIPPGFYSKWGGLFSTTWLVISLSFGVGYSYHRMQTKARKTEKRYRLLNDSLLEGFFVTDTSGYFIEANKAFCTMLGYPLDELLHINEETITPVQWHKKDTSIIESQVITRGYSDVYEKVFTTKSNRHIRVELRKYIHVEKQKIKGIWAIVRDVTEKNRLQQQLIQAQKMDTIGQLAGGIAHDLNNMLGGIFGFSEMLMDSLTREPVKKNREYVHNIIQIARKAAKLNNQLLTFSRQSDVITMPIDVHTAIDEVILILERSIDKKIRICKEYHAAKHVTFGDVIHIQNAVLNLGINARDAMPDGGNLVISTRNIFIDRDFDKIGDFTTTTGEYIEISIADTGTGIPENIRDKIFEPFFTTKEAGKGTGLGLAAVYRTVKEHKGAISLYSNESTGTTFNLYFRLYEKSEKKEDNSEIEIKKGSGTILVGEDDKALQLIFHTLLEQLGYNTIITENGKEALECYENNHKAIDLVILDIIMPVFNGVEVYEKMKKINPGVKVILCSGYSGGYNIDDLFKMGVTNFIKKPFSRRTLSRVIYEALSEKPVIERTILFVDDEESIVRMIREFLTSIGHSLECFTDPLQAYERFKQAPGIFDMAVIDNIMPEMDGLILSEKLLSIRSNLPIILSTGYATPELESKIREIGVKQILKKPYSLSELLERLQ